MSKDKPQLYFKNDSEWRAWLQENHHESNGIYIILYKIETKKPSMRWE